MSRKGELGTAAGELRERLGGALLAAQATADGIPTLWVGRDDVRTALSFLKNDLPHPYRMLWDLTGIDERERNARTGQPVSDFTVVYTLLSLDRREMVRVKVALTGREPGIPTVCDLWPNANWYERELWDMFGVNIDGHPDLRRILLPPWWQGHALRKEHPARATDLPPFEMPPERREEMLRELRFRPEDWGLQSRGEDVDYMFLNIGPNHPGTHGVLRLVLQMLGDQIIDIVPDIGYHHRGAEKMGERQTWHTYIPYTDRVDYLAGVLNNLPYVLSVEKLAGIEAPPRARYIRIMMCELFRIISHLVFYGTFAQDLGLMSPVFYLFTDREKALDIAEAVTGARMHPGWFRIGGVAADLPEGWEPMVREFLAYLPPRLREYDRMVMDNPIFKGRTVGVGQFDIATAVEWGATGPMLRACGVPWDVRRTMPYGGYEEFEFDVAVGTSGDCYDRCVVHIEEMRQSLRIIEQCVDRMPGGDCKARHPLTTPPIKPRTMHDIETLITHFLNETWGPVIPAGEALVNTESAKGQYGYYLVSDGNTHSYRTRIRTASFPHIQMVPYLSRGLMVPDLVAILGALDFVLADVDR